MILEVVDIRIQPGQQTAFEQAVRAGIATAIAPAKGFGRYELRHSLESPERYLLLIHWETLADHTEGFRNSPAYGPWRTLVGPFFAQPPLVEHFAACAAH